MPLSSGQISIGMINMEIGWDDNVSGKTNSYLVGAGPTGSTYPNYQTDSVYGWFTIDQYPVRTLTQDLGNGNYSYKLCQFICEQTYLASFPGDAASYAVGGTGGPWADTQTTWNYDTTYFDGFGNTIYSDANYVSAGATCDTRAMPIVICYVPGSCYVVSTSCSSTSPTSTGNLINSPLQTTFYLGYFNNKTRGKKISCTCT
jgi:hypothetical protein